MDFSVPAGFSHAYTISYSIPLGKLRRVIGFTFEDTQNIMVTYGRKI